MSTRVDFFKPSGKFYTSEQVQLESPYTFLEDVDLHLKGRLRGMFAVVGGSSPWGYPMLCKLPEDKP